MTAPVIAVIGYDLDFSDHMGKLFPHMDVAPMYKGNQEFNHSAAFEIALFKEHISWWSVEP